MSVSDSIQFMKKETKKNTSRYSFILASKKQFPDKVCQNRFSRTPQSLRCQVSRTYRRLSAMAGSWWRRRASGSPRTSSGASAERGRRRAHPGDSGSRRGRPPARSARSPASWSGAGTRSLAGRSRAAAARWTRSSTPASSSRLRAASPAVRCVRPRRSSSACPADPRAGPRTGNPGP